MIRVGIIGGESPLAGELIRLLLNHPDVQLEWVHSCVLAGKAICYTHQGLIGETNLVFSSDMPFEKANVIFLCLPNGKSRRFVESHDIPEEIRIIDLSSDFKINDGSHDFIYGLPELNRKYIIRGKHVANPGNLATAILLALLPLAKNLLLNSDIHIHAVTSNIRTGMAEETATTCPAWQDNNVAVYAPFFHPQLKEVRQALSTLQNSFRSDITLIPMQSSISRGIYIAAYLDCPISLEELKKIYEEYYDDHNFTFISENIPEWKDVANTNKCILYLTKEGKKLLVIATIDSLLKGAAGQAVHNMNLLFGLHERIGLQLKASIP